MHVITIIYGTLTFSFFLFCTNSSTKKKHQDDRVTNLRASAPPNLDVTTAFWTGVSDKYFWSCNALRNAGTTSSNSVLLNLSESKRQSQKNHGDFSSLIEIKALNRRRREPRVFYQFV